MRLAVHHKHRVVEGSVLFAAILTTNLYLSLAIFYPVMLSLIGLKWSSLDFVDRSWYLSLVTAFAVFEIPRVYTGNRGNKDRSVSSMIGFVALTLSTHLAIMAVYHSMVPQKNSLDYAVSAVELILGSLELVLAFVEIRKMVRSNTVNFYIRVGVEV